MPPLRTARDQEDALMRLGRSLLARQPYAFLSELGQNYFVPRLLQIVFEDLL